MSSRHDNLTDDQRALLRLAGELPAGAGRNGYAAEGVDGSAELREAFARLDGPLTLEAARLPLPPAGPAVRAVVRAMQDAGADPGTAVKTRWRPPAWVIYPSAAAAALALAMVGWWYSVHDQFAKAPDPLPTDLGPPVLVLPGGPDANTADRTDEQILHQFDSMIVPPDRPSGGELERQMAALKFLEESVQ